MRRELHLFAIISVFTCVWTLGADRVVWTYLHVLIMLLRLYPHDNDWRPIHRWYVRYAACNTHGTYDLKLGIRGNGCPRM